MTISQGPLPSCCALADSGNRETIGAAEIGETWLNYVIEDRTVLWWGGFGNSTEHTAFVRLQHGIEAPRSGSIEFNGKIVAEQIGAQIFIDSWAMVAPGNPKLAFDLAAKSGKRQPRWRSRAGGAISCGHGGAGVC